jgi:hypothetical protein
MLAAPNSLPCHISSCQPLGAEGYRAYLEKARRFIVSIETSASQTRPDLSYMGAMTGPPKLAVVNFIHVAPGRGVDFENIIKTEVLPAVKKAGVIGYFVSQTVFGGDTNAYTTVTLADSFSEIAKGSPIQRALGEAGFNRLVRRTAGIITRQERAIARYNPELSIAPSQ